MKPLGLIFALLSVAFAQDLAPRRGPYPTLARPDYFPLSVGNLWLYQGSGTYSGNFLTLEITQAQSFAGVSYFLLHGFPQKDYWIRENSKDIILAYDTTAAIETVWWEFDTLVGQPYSSTAPALCCGLAQVQSRMATYKGPLGAFDRALTMYYPGTFQVGVFQDTFLPGIGLVYRNQATGGPSVGSWDLIYARVGGTTIDSAPEFSFSLALDNTIYTANRTPPVDPATAPVMTARLRLRNTAQPVPLTYPTTQIYDLEIKDDKGNVVYRWSDNMAFGQVVHTETFGSGEHDYAILVRLVGRDKNLLPTGKYVVEAWLTTANPPAFFASLPVEIR